MPFSDGPLGTGTAGIRFKLNTAGVTTYTGSLKLRCTETTLTVGYNTSVTDFNFLEVTNLRPNTTNVFQAGEKYNLAGTVSAYSSTGASGFSAFMAGFPEEKRTDLNILTLVGAGEFGFIRIAHYGSP